MQQISNNKNWQSDPKEKLASNFPEKEKLKLEKANSSEEILMTPSWEQTILEKLFQNIPYPDFRYFCPSCGSLDVYISSHRQTHQMIVKCLDCKKGGIQEYLHEGRTTTCLC